MTYAYLDHNILDHMIKVETSNFEVILEELELTPVYSDETLNEIRRSEGSQDRFISILQKIKARYLHPELDKNSTFTGYAQIDPVDVSAHYEFFINNYVPPTNTGFGFNAMIQKMYNGRPDESFTEIFEKAKDEIQTLFNTADFEFEDDKLTSAFQSISSSLLETTIGHMNDIGMKLDAEDNASVSATDKLLKVGPKVLNNIHPPGIVNQIIEFLEDENSYADFQYTKLFDGSLISELYGRKMTSLEKVNALYHLLNYFGYHRDKKLQHESKFTASSSDLTHVGYASFCSFLFSFDKDLIYKASAAYEYLKIGTKTVLFQNKPD